MNLATRDIRHNLGRFALTTVGIGMLLMVVGRLEIIPVMVLAGLLVRPLSEPARAVRRRRPRR